MLVWFATHDPAGYTGAAKPDDTYASEVASCGPGGPRFVPVIVSTPPPAVAAGDGSVLTLVSVGGAYDVISGAELAVCRPTVTLHVKFAPTPATVAHTISVCATVTEQPLALYMLPALPYCAVTGVPAGPNHDPVSVTFSPPVVDMDTDPERAVISGGA